MQSSREEVVDAAIDVSDSASAGDALHTLIENNANADILQVAAAVNTLSQFMPELGRPESWSVSLG